MNAFKMSLFGLSSLGSIALLSGCVVTEHTSVYDDRRYHHYPERDVVVVDRNPPPPPPVVYQQPPRVIVQEAPPQPVVIIRREPPPRRAEVRPRSPGSGYVWIDGYNVARGGHWEWMPGHWEQPPRRGAVWVAPRVDRHGDEFHFSMGFWK